MARFDADAVRRYYDRNTAAFVSLGQGAGAIHRAVWGPGVETREQAFHFVDDRVAALARDLLRTTPEPHVVDLGCGVGASLLHLAAQLPIRGTGVTLSPRQAAQATARIAAAGLGGRLTCVEADYTALPRDLPPADLAFAVESFVHGPSPARFFAECARLVRPGGVLAICDDVRRPSADPAAARAVDRFCRGWRVNTLLTRDELLALAADAGFAHAATTDLTPWLELGRPRDRLFAALAALAGWLPLDGTRLGPVLGGSALQTCLKKRWVGYELVVFQRRA